MQYKVIKDNAVAYKNNTRIYYATGVVNFDWTDLYATVEVQPLDFNPINIIINDGTKNVVKFNSQVLNVVCGFITSPIIPGTLPPQYDLDVCFLESDVQAINAVKIAGYNFNFTTVLVVLGLSFLAYKLFKKKKHHVTL
jgi:hypothetical protein